MRGKLTPKLFAELPHIDVEVALGRKGFGHQQAAQHWRTLGLERQVRFTVPYFTTAALIAARTDCIAGLPHRVAEPLADALPIKIVSTTFPLPTMRISLVWHERTDADPGALFFRNVVMNAVRFTVSPEDPHPRWSRTEGASCVDTRASDEETA